MQQPRRLTVIRHARAEQAAPSDHERELTSAGRELAAALGERLAAAGTAPDHALVSAALRARQTWEALAAGAGWDLEPEVSQGLYAAEPESALDLLRELPVDATSVVVVGHNPTMASLAQTLDDGQGDDEAVTGLVTGGFPPCSAAEFEHDGEWADLGWSAARLVGYRGGS